MKARKWNVQGQITNMETAHGLIYQVHHEDGTRGWYEPGELEPNMEQRIKNKGW